MSNRRAVSLTCSLAIMCIALTSSLFSESKGKVLLIAREKSTSMEFFIDYEVKPLIRLLETGGYEVVVVDESGRSIKAGAAELAMSGQLSKIDIGDYKAILIPCMGAEDFPVSEEIIDCVNLANAKGMPIAMQHCREITSLSDLKNREISRRPGVVIDGNLITTHNCPYTAGENGRPIDNAKLIEALLKMLQNG
jgi:hypothetical protein